MAVVVFVVVVGVGVVDSSKSIMWYFLEEKWKNGRKWKFQQGLDEVRIGWKG